MVISSCPAGRLRLVIDKAVVAYRKPLDRPSLTVLLRSIADVPN